MSFGFEQKPVRCRRCQLLMVLENNGTLPLHWPKGKLCIEAVTKEYTR